MAANFYSVAKNNPEVLEKRKQRIAALDSEIKLMQITNPGRTPDWDEERIMKMDRAALEMGKRCIMWDDKGAGFFLMLNWDWVHNRPESPPTPQAAFHPGWWINAKELLTPPLLDSSIPETKLAAWLDQHTMNVHSKLLKKLDKVRLAAVDDNHNDNDEKKRSAVFVLDDPYWQQLQALPGDDDTTKKL